MTGSLPHYLSVREFGILVFLAMALSVVLFHMTAHLAPRHKDNEYTFITSNATLSDYLQLREEWRPRILSNVGAHICNILADKITKSPETHLKTTVGIYSAGWLLLINLTIILAFGSQGLTLMWGIFAAIVFGYAPGLVSRVYPWDMPALFFFTLFVACYHKGFYKWIPIVIVLGALFKETTAALCVSALFFPIPWRDRLKLTLVTGALFIAVKLAVDLAVGIPLPFFSPTIHRPNSENLRFIGNLMTLLQTPLHRHPVWINAGSLLALMILPGKDRTLLMLKCVASFFALNIFVFGQIKEYRIWFEVAPLAVYVLAILPWSPTLNQMKYR